MITKFNYNSTTVNSLFLDIVNFANIEAIKAKKQNWFIADTCVNDSVLTLRTLFEHAGVQITSPSFADSLFEIFKDAGLDSNVITLDPAGKIVFYFKNHLISVTATDEVLVYHSTSSEFNTILSSSAYDYFAELNIWELLIEILNLLLQFSST